MEPPVFVLPLSCWFQNCFGFQDWTYFSGRRKLLTTLNHKGPPLWWKIWFIFWKLFLIAQKKCPDALNATQKTPALHNVPFLKKSRKTAKNAHFFKNAVFWSFFLELFRNVTLHGAWVFCVVFSAPGRFFWAIIINIPTSFQNFHHKGGPFWFWVVKSSRQPLK